MLELIERPLSLLIKVIDKEHYADFYEHNEGRFEIGDMLEESKHLGNGWVDGSGCFALTDAPIICTNVYFDDDGRLEFYTDSKIYFFDNYMIQSFEEELLENGEVVFRLSSLQDTNFCDECGHDLPDEFKAGDMCKNCLRLHEEDEDDETEFTTTLKYEHYCEDCNNTFWYAKEIEEGDFVCPICNDRE